MKLKFILGIALLLLSGCGSDQKDTDKSNTDMGSDIGTNLNTANTRDDIVDFLNGIQDELKVMGSLLSSNTRPKGNEYDSYKDSLEDFTILVRNIKITKPTSQEELDILNQFTRVKTSLERLIGYSTSYLYEWEDTYFELYKDEYNTFENEFYILAKMTN